MKVEAINFQGVAVGFQFIAEHEHERYLLRSLHGVEAKALSGAQNGPIQALILSPSLPWENQEQPAPLAVV